MIHKKNMERKFFITTFLFIQLFLVSCKKYLEITPSPDLVTTESLFSDDQSATSAINGLYSQMMTSNTSLGNSGVSLCTSLSGDELVKTFPDANLSPFQNNDIPVNNAFVDGGLWKSAYKYIYQANVILAGLASSTNISAAVADQLKGEAKFIRAYCNFYLVNLFGDVPLITSSNYQQNMSLPRIPVDQVYFQIVEDLKDAQHLMSNDYPSSGRVRPNKSVATALLARVYLYLEKWEDAELQSSTLIETGTYSLCDLNEVFVANSSETIWQLIPVLTFLNTADGVTFIPYSSSVIPQYAVSEWLLNSFEADDQRKTNWLMSNTVNGQDYYYPFKYKVRSGNIVTEYNMVFRLAEQYLIRAEARARQNKIDEAKNDLNIIRARAGLPIVTMDDQSTLLTAIFHERQVELFVEGGHRWFDLKRAGAINDILGAEKTGWTQTDAFYPIPLTELKANVTLSQNAGY